MSNNNHRALNGRESGREREKKKSRPNDINANKNELNNKTNNNFGVIYIYNSKSTSNAMERQLKSELCALHASIEILCISESIREK